MNFAERQERLIRTIHSIKDEETLAMLEESLKYFTDNSSDITDGLTPYQLDELATLVNEPSEKDTNSEEAYKKATKKWRTK